MTGDPTGELTRLLVLALRALVEAGRPADASTLAAAGWAASRRAHPTADSTGELTRLLARALQALVEAGRPADASALAAAGCAALRHESPAYAERLTGLLYQPAGEQSCHGWSGPRSRAPDRARTHS